MAIVLLLLKIIGILILAIVGLALFLVLLLLLVPICYRLKTTYEAQLTIEGTIRFLGPMLRCRFFYTLKDDFVYHVRVLWFTIVDSQKKENEHQSEKVESNQEQNSSIDESSVPLNQPTQTSSETDTTKQVSRQKLNPKQEVRKKHVSKQETRKKDTHKKRKFSSIFLKIKCWFQSMQKKWNAFVKALQKKKDKAAYLKKLVEHQTTKDSVQAVKKEVKWLLKHYKPRKIEGYLCFGTSDPALTGEILAMLALIYPFGFSNVRVSPNFEQECFEEDIIIKGHIQLYVVAVAALKLYFNKKVKTTIKRFKKIRGGN